MATNRQSCVARDIAEPTTVPTVLRAGRAFMLIEGRMVAWHVVGLGVQTSQHW